MKISAQILAFNEEDYLPFCLESLIGVVDEVVVIEGGSHDDTLKIVNEYANKGHYDVKIIMDDTRDDYAFLRNKALEETDADYVLMIDADEVLANADGSRVTREQLVDASKSEFDSLGLFTYHFVYNYSLLDGRREGIHVSPDRFYKNKEVRYINKMHEHPVFGYKAKRGTMRAPILWHFGGCKSPEKTRRKYLQCSKIYPEMLKGFKDVDEYCSKHSLFTGMRPIINYNGPLPKVMRLW